MTRRSPISAALLVAAIGCATLPALGCLYPFWDKNIGGGSHDTGTQLYGVYFNPYMPYPDQDLWVTLSYSGTMDAAHIHWFLNGTPLPSLTNLTRMPAGTAKAGDSVLVRARIIFGSDSTAEQANTTVIQPIPVMHLSAPVLNYLDYKGIGSLAAILSGWMSSYSGGGAVADTVTTDANGNAAFTIDGRTIPPYTVAVDGQTTWYSVSRNSTIIYTWNATTGMWENQLDTVRMVPKLVDANSVDKLDYCRRVTGTAGSAGGLTTLLSWGKPLLLVYLNRAAAPAGVADSAWQAFNRWNVARGVPLFVETQIETSSSDVVVVYDTVAQPGTALTSSTVGYPTKLVKATIHVPSGTVPDTAFVRKMVKEAGRAQGMSLDFSIANYAMSLVNPVGTPKAVEIGCSLMLSNLPSGLDMSQYR